MAGCMGGYGGARMKVYLDSKRVQCSSFKEYMSMYDGMENPVIFEKISDRWEVSRLPNLMVLVVELSRAASRTLSYCVLRSD